MPSPKYKSRSRDRKAEAIAKLRQKWEAEHEGEEWEAEREPIVTPLFKSVEGGVSAVIEALRSHDEGDAETFLSEYDSLGSTDQKLVPLEYVAFTSGVGSLRLAELAQTALFLYASMQTKLLISGSMAKVTKAIVKAATDEAPIFDREGIQIGRTNGDVKAMELFGKMSGIVPIPKGATIAIQNNYGEKEESAPSAPAWKTSEERLREIQDMTEPKRLPSPATPPIHLGGHIDHMQAETVEILRGE